MSSAAMQTAQRSPSHSSSPYINSTRAYAPQSSSSHEQFYGATSSPSASSRHHGRGATNASAVTPQQFYSPTTSEPSSATTPRNQHIPRTTSSPQSPAAAPSPNVPRSRHAPPDQYDGAPVVPPRTTSQQYPTTTTNAVSNAQSRNGGGRRRNQEDDDMVDRFERLDVARTQPEPERGSAPSSATRDRRRAGPAETSPREGRGQTAHIATQARSERDARPAHMDRAYSEVINRVAVSDPVDDLERERERMAEAQPGTTGTNITPVTGLGLVGSEGVEDGGRGTQRRQDYSSSNARRKDVKFGDYMLGQTLGEGEFGKVKLGWKRDGSVQVAIKLIRRESVASNPTRLPKIYREISILRELSHPNIVRLHEMVETDRHIGIILEYASGGELFDYILNHRYLKDPAARRLFAQLVSGVGYLHKKGIVHRDLKLENLLLDRNRNIIITDFGFANTFNPTDELGDEIEYNLSNREFVRKMRLDRVDEKGMRRGDLMQTSCGSPCYAAPELVVSDSLYTGRKVDVWSCGVILYAMLAGYLPFDDDPANPEGDNINLLYKYITTTPLTFPEYVTPHARDLLRRILVPDPRKRADLFEVARHSWLSEYHHVVSHITSSTTNVSDIANTTVPAGKLDSLGLAAELSNNREEEQQEAPQLMRSASVREPSKPHSANATSPVGGLSHTSGNIAPEEQAETSKSQRDTKRRTVQVEYVAPQSQTTRGEGVAPLPANRTRSGSQPQTEPVRTQPTTSEPLPTQDTRKVADYPPTSQQMPPPTRPPKDVPRSVSESGAAFGVPSVTRPGTGGSMTSGGARLPSRGSYGQPVAPTVAPATAQGRLAQPTSKAGRGYNMSGQTPQHRPQGSESFPRSETQQLPGSFNETQAIPLPRGHRRSSTLSSLGEKLFGRSNSTKAKQGETGRPKREKKYPPTAMKDPYPNDNSRASMDSKRSVSFGFGKKKSIDLESQEEKPRRFSFLPGSFSLRGLSGASQEDVPQMAQVNDFPQPPPGSRNRPTTGGQRTTSYGTEDSMPLGTDGQSEHQQYRGSRSFSSRNPQPYASTSQPSAPPNDVYGGTGVYNRSGPSETSYLRAQTPPPMDAYDQGSQHPIYQEGYRHYDGSQSRGLTSSGREKPGVLQKPRKFADAYDYEAGPGHHDGSSGAARKVMDFFRRRGKARAGE